MPNSNSSLIDQTFFLSEIIGKKIIFKNKKIGRLAEMVIVENGKAIPEVTKIIVNRSFGYQSLLIPWNKVKSIHKKNVEIEIKSIEQYEKDPDEKEILLKDHVLDKKVLDLDDHEVEVVYDVKLTQRRGKLYVSEVDFSKYGLLRRVGLKWLANWIYNLADILKKDTLSWSYIQPLPKQLTSFKGNVKLNVLKENLDDIHPVDLADMLEELNHEQRLAIFNELDIEQASDTLEEIEPRVQRDLISSIDIKKAAELINDMTPAQAADILAILPASDTDTILDKIDKESRSKIELLLDKHDEKIGNFATTHYLKFFPDTQIKSVLSQFRHYAEDMDVLRYIYVTDEQDKLLGVVNVLHLLINNPEDKLDTIMTEHVISLTPENTLSEAASMFTRYSFRAMPIVDENEKILGVIPYRDIMNLNHHFI